MKETRELMDFVLSVTELGKALSDGFDVSDISAGIDTVTSAANGLKGIKKIPQELNEATIEQRDAFVTEYSEKIIDTVPIENKKQVVADLLDATVLIARSAFVLMGIKDMSLEGFSSRAFLNV